jgi:hypothetical protein
MLQAKPPRLAFRTASTKTSTDEPASDIILPEETLQTSTLLSRTGLSALIVVVIAVTAAFAGGSPKDHKGTPYKDDHHPNRVQSIPGRVECALYDRGGEGVAYHDTEPKNLGSGTLNPADGTYLNQFRMDEGVETSYTKFHNAPDRIDDNPYDVVQPPDKQLYAAGPSPENGSTSRCRWRAPASTAPTSSIPRIAAELSQSISTANPPADR